LHLALCVSLGSKITVAEHHMMQRSLGKTIALALTTGLLSARRLLVTVASL
jgi:hypothetical protein